MTSRRLVVVGAVLAAIYLLTLVVAIPEPVAVGIKTASTLALVAAAAVAPGPGTRLLALGVAFHAAGDALIETAPLPAAMGAFLVGHLLYVAVLIRWRRPWHALPAGRRVLAGALAAACVTLVVVVVPKAGALAVPVTVYALAILAMALAAAFALAPAAVAAGAALYVGSDSILAVDLFVGAIAGSGFVTWPAYWIGQALVVTGALSRIAATAPPAVEDRASGAA